MELRNAALGVLQVAEPEFKAAAARGLQEALAQGRTEVQRLMRDCTPVQLEMVYALWTSQATAEVIRGRYCVKLAVRTMGLYLERRCFTPH